MTPIERAARAACASGGFDPDEIMTNDGPRWRYYVPQAHAVIQSLREPSEGMLLALAQPPGYASRYHAKNRLRAGLSAMIDVALSE